MIQIAFMRFVHRETESLCAENIGLKDIARSRRGKLISRGELIMYYKSNIPSAVAPLQRLTLPGVFYSTTTLLLYPILLSRQ